MTNKSIIYFSVFFLSAFLAACDRPDGTEASTPPANALFEKVSPDVSDIDFSNDIKFDEDFNIYTYRNFYNGGGVALGDINNDGLVDIYFTANQKKNKLYLNKGNFEFEDITESAGVGGNRAWSTGVAMADVNGDGFLDIYVCNSGDVKGDNRENELFINNGNLTFTEKAKEYGLADEGYTTHAAFFDFDRDGDLDVYILNNSYQSIGSFNLRKNERPNRDRLGGDKLFRNDGGIFTDVSEKAGIYGSVIGFGLGVTVGDVNRDSWPDIYVSNDFFERDYLYINNQDGTFKEDLTSQMTSISAASMGADLADVNNDGFPDLFVTEMLPREYRRLKTVTTFEDWNRYQYNISNDYYHQFTRNTFQINNQNGTFSEVARLAGVEATDWSWGALMFDMNNDGLRDIFVSNGIRQDLTNQDFLQYAASEEFVKTVVSNNKVNYKKLVEVIPTEAVPDYAFLNMGNLTFQEKGRELGLGDNNFSNGAAYGDLDNDGDLDLVINHVDAVASLFRNRASELEKNHYIKFKLLGQGKNAFAIGAQVELKVGNRTMFAEQIPTRGFESSVDPRIHFGLGKDALVTDVKIIWPSGKTTRTSGLRADSTYVFDERYATDSIQLDLNRTRSSQLFRSVQFESTFAKDTENVFNDFDRERLLYTMISNEGPRMCVADVNGDKRDDMFIAGSKGEAGRLLVQTPMGEFTPRSQRVLEADANSEDCGCAFFDADKDGDQDLYVTSGSSEFPGASTDLIDRLYINDGQGNLSKVNKVYPVEAFESNSVVVADDFDKDGDQDLFVGGRMVAMQYGVPANSYLLRNDGRGNFTNATNEIAPMLTRLGLVTDAVWSDVDRDGYKDLIVVGEWMSPKIFLNKSSKFQDGTAQFGLTALNGMWNRIVTADLDNDGDEDYVLANQGLNTRFRAEASKPVRMYVSDFDRNGSVEQVICRWWGDKELPYALRHDLISQMPELKKKFVTYESFSKLGLPEIFGLENINSALKLEIHEVRTGVLWNEGTQLNFKALPVEAQYSSVYAVYVDDVDGDGRKDILIGGNQYRVKPEIGRFDAGYGALFSGMKDRQFSFVPFSQSGIHIRGEIRDIKKLSVAGKPRIMVLRNNDYPIILEKQ